MEELSEIDQEYLLARAGEGIPVTAVADPSASGEPDVADPAACIGRELRRDAARRLAGSVLRMDRFLRRDECPAGRTWDPMRRLGRTLIAEAHHLLRNGVRDSGAPPSEPTLRSAYRLIGALDNLAAWGAPATHESCALASYPVAAARDVVAYSRFGSAEIAVQEAVYATMLGFHPAHARLLLTSSGMTAYALIEAYLLREVLLPHDRILLHPSVYFETRQQLVTLRHVEAFTAAGAGRVDMLAAIAAYRPRVVFVDPLSNAADFRVIDMLALLDQADQVCDRETWFVVDSTLLSGGFDPFSGPRRKHVRVLYYESGCKYLQFGMDLGPVGLVVVEARQAERFEELRRGIGAVGSDALVLPRASREAYLGYLRAQTACAERVARAVTFASRASAARVIEAVHPSQDSHPDFVEAQRYPHLGAVMVFRFADPQLNRRRPLEIFIDALIERARAADLSLTAGVSFGFRVPRIGAAWSSYEKDEAFLRLSAGIDLASCSELGQLIVECAQQFSTAVVP